MSEHKELNPIVPRENPITTQAFENQAAEVKQLINRHFEILGGLLADISKAQQKKIHKQYKKLIPGKDVEFNFDVMSIYVDNSQNASPLYIQSEAGLTYTVDGNSQKWIHPLGGTQFFITGTGTYAPALFVDEFLAIN